MESKLKPHLKLRKLPKDYNEKTCGDRIWRERLETMQGWLSPEGKLYYCNGEGHETLADMITEELYRDKFKGISASSYLHYGKGWVKLHFPEGFLITWPEFHDPTQKQIDFMFDYVAKHKLDQDIYKDLETKQANVEQRVKWNRENGTNWRVTPKVIDGD